MEELERLYTGLLTRPLPAGPVAERPLSSVERRLFKGAQAASEKGVTGFALVRLAFQVDGPLDVPAMVRAMDALFVRHDAMRTSYAERDGAPVAQVHASVPSAVRVVDCAGDEARAKQEFERESAAGFRIDTAPLHRFLITRLGPDSHQISHFAHHIVCDALSDTILLRELAELYGASSGREPKPLRQPRLQYSDVALWQERSFDAAARAEHAAFWQTLRPSGPLPPPIAAIGARCLRDTDRRWMRSDHHTAAELGRALKAFSRARGASEARVLFVVLLALMHAEGAGGSPVGFMSANRRFETVRVVGLFATLVPVLVPLSGESSFAEVIERANRALSESLRHQEFPPASPTDAEQPYRIVFSYRDFGRDEDRFKLPGFDTRLIARFEKRRALYDLWLNVGFAGNDLLRISSEHCADLIGHELLEKFHARFEALLAAAISDPDKRLDELARLVS